MYLKRVVRYAVASLTLSVCAVAWPTEDTPAKANDPTAASSPATITGQLARWRVGICPLVRGLSPAFNDFISARVQAIAATVGVPEEKAEHCKQNVQIIFTTEPQKVLEDVVKHYTWMLGYHHVSQERRIATFSRPIQAWYVTATRGGFGEEYIDDVFGSPPPGLLGSRLTTGQSTSVVFVLIVADTSQIEGFTIGSISDYAAMVALSQPQSLDGCSELPSIVDLLSSTCAAGAKSEAMTAGDIAYLRALYSTYMEQPLSLQRSDIRNKMMQEFGVR